MAGGSRTLKLTILGDVDNLRKSLTDANKDVETSSSKLGDFSAKAGLAFAAAGVAAAAYAGKLLIDGVKSAIEDEAAQAKLATTLENVTGATKGQIKSTEDYILKTSLATGITDNELRPSLERLVRSTKDVEEAQKLQSLAIDIAAGSGKSLEAVSNALAKSHDGQNTALGKLGVGIDAATLKTMTFDEITVALGKTFEDQATKKAETFAGKMERLKVAIDEGKESAGSFVLDAITPMVSTLVNNVIPAVQDLADKIGKNLKPVFTELATFFTETFIPAVTKVWNFIKDKLAPIFMDIFKPAIEGIITVFKSLNTLVKENSGFFELIGTALNALLKVAKLVAPYIGGAFKTAWSGVAKIIDGVSAAIGLLVDGINLAISAINLLIKAYNVVNNLIPGSKDLKEIPKLAQGGAVSANKPYIVGEVGAELFVPSSSGRIVPNNQLGGGGGSTINLTVNGAIDAESTARQIISILNNSFYRGTGGAGALVTP
ncbi:hypothetical protein UFOVP1399_6 [uncultured Caudovirales phage]|uniref:Bacteriophage lambda, GpH, tail tape measure, C-terminal n=1 Tax=uncultured Caudovirales phage TaxID=2100421 RepID=A0A6J5S7I5_9CAUD|nr:hypothetical protein UFOVP1399_6 [uncultured Caudovirales phage]